MCNPENLNCNSYFFPSPSPRVPMRVSRRRFRPDPAARCLQVVRPRRWRAGWRSWFVAGSETPSTPLSDLGVHCASRSPVTGGGGSQAPDCILSCCVGGVSVSLEPLSSNIRFLARVDVLGLLVNLYPPRVTSTS